MQVNISIIIVNFNAGNLLVQCVRSALDSSVPVEVIVVDNGSGDGSIHRLRQQIRDQRLRVIENFANLGFARASNIGLEEAKGGFILLLNPDCIIFSDTLARMLAVMEEEPQVGMAGCLIRNPDGSEQAGCRRMVPTPARSLVRMLHLDHMFPFLHEKGILLHTMSLPDEPVNVEAISGAFMLVRHEALEEVGPLDDAYFLHCEDLDWCMRFRQKGWKILFDPTAEIVHKKGACSVRVPIRVEWHKHCGMVRFYRQFFRHQYPMLFMWLVICAVWFRFGLLAAYLAIGGRR